MSAVKTDMPQGITHLEIHGKGTATFWKIPRPEHADGTGDFWRDGVWITSEISDTFVNSLVSLSGTLSHLWTEDPHAGQYDGERAELVMGDLTDDMLANGLFLYDHRSGLQSISWLTAAKERIRWLSRKLDSALKAGKPRRCWINQPSNLQPLHKYHGTNVIAVPYTAGASAVYPLEGEVTSMVVPSEVLSEGWASSRTPPVHLPPRMTEQREIQELLGRFGVYGQVPAGVATQIYNAALDHTRELNDKLAELPIKVVADISGGALHGVYAEVPVEVLFISDDADDVINQTGDKMLLNTRGNPTASWTQTSDGGEDAEMVQHYFGQE